MLFPQTERTIMDLILTKGDESAFDTLDKNRFQTETMGLVSDMEKPDSSHIVINLIALGIFSLMVIRK